MSNQAETSTNKNGATAPAQYKNELERKRNKSILGLLIYQGIKTTELKKIEKAHLNLLQGTVYIPSAGRSNSRILKLNARQIIPIQQYLQSIEKEQACPDKVGEKLFNCNITSVSTRLIKILRKQNKKIKDARQIRSSALINWLRQYNIRQAQYMAGHRHIGSTEKYKQEGLQDLQKQLELFSSVEIIKFKNVKFAETKL